jgi:hypothetical protein
MTPRRDVRGRSVIETRRAQRSFGDGLIAAEVADLHEAWMRQADRALDDPQIVAVVIDTTVVETNIHYPTDSSLLGDIVRVLTRTMRKIAGIAETAGAKLRDRTRSVRHHLLNIARAAHSKSQPNQGKLTEIYGKLLAATGRVVGQARRFSREIAGGVKRAADPRRQLRLVALRQQLEQMLPRIGQVMRQTHARIFAGDTHAEGKIVSIFEPSTEVIRKGKAGKPTEFGKMVKLQVIKRRHGLIRSRYKSDDGMKRWVGLGVIADNLLNIGHVLAKPQAKSQPR